MFYVLIIVEYNLCRTSFVCKMGVQKMSQKRLMCFLGLSVRPKIDPYS